MEIDDVEPIGPKTPTQNSPSTQISNHQSAGYITPQKSTESTELGNKRRAVSVVIPRYNFNSSPVEFDFTRNKNETRTRIGKTFTTAKEAIAASLDCLIKAIDLENDEKKTNELLDLVGIFREYTTTGVVNTKTILSTQVKAFENVSRSLSKQAKEITQQNIQTTQNKTKQSYAQVVDNLKEWTTIQPKQLPYRKQPQVTTPKKTTQVVIKPKDISSDIITSFSALSTRNALNKAFGKTVIRTISLSERKNLTLTPNDGYTADFLIKNRETIERIVPIKEIIENKTWFKVAVHGVPTQDLIDLSPNEFAETIKNEVLTFNNLKVVNRPFWLSTRENRESKAAGTILIAFETEKEAEIALNRRLYIAGASTKAVKLIEKPRPETSKDKPFNIALPMQDTSITY